MFRFAWIVCAKGLFLTFTVLSGVRSLQEEVEAGVMARFVPAS